MFNIGDTIKVKNGKRYAVTTGDWQGKVIATMGEKKILAYGTLDHKFYTLDVKDLVKADNTVHAVKAETAQSPKELKWEAGARVKIIKVDAAWFHSCSKMGIWEPL